MFQQLVLPAMVVEVVVAFTEEVAAVAFTAAEAVDSEAAVRPSAVEEVVVKFSAAAVVAAVVKSFVEAGVALAGSAAITRSMEAVCALQPWGTTSAATTMTAPPMVVETPSTPVVLAGEIATGIRMTGVAATGDTTTGTTAGMEAGTTIGTMEVIGAIALGLMAGTTGAPIPGAGGAVIQRLGD